MTSRTVFVFWNSNMDPHRNAKDYRECVEAAPDVEAGCRVTCQLIDVSGNDTAKQYWSGASTIEVVGVKDGEKLPPLVNPSFVRGEIHEMVARLCA